MPRCVRVWRHRRERHRRMQRGPAVDGDGKDSRRRSRDDLNTVDHDDV